jgi:probable H4MPT-linked C1 transfer pathway protein
VWQTDGRFVEVGRAVNWKKIAANNWHALATWAGQLVPDGCALLIDIGSTTTDIIPLRDGLPGPRGFTDPQRLLSGELVYLGVRRTPLCGLALGVPIGEVTRPLVAELFATMLDIHLLLGSIAENVGDCDTANGRPATISAAHDRLARQFCCDRTEFSLQDAIAAARFLADVQRQRLNGALEKVLARLPGPCEAVIVSGSGEFLARELVAQNPRTSDARVISLSELLTSAAAEGACAYAVARLAESLRR